jgi:hypothetical protein
MQGKRRGRLAAAAALAAFCCLGLSGCFLWSSFKWSSTTVKPGRSVDAVIGMTPETSGQGNKDYPFIMVGLSDPSNLSLAGISKRTWDVKGRFGGPEPLAADGGLESAVLASDNCNINGIEIAQIPDTAWTALRPDAKVNDRDKAGRVALSKIRLRAGAAASATNEQVYLFSGGWSDNLNDNGIAEPDEVGCSGGTITALAIAG